MSVTRDLWIVLRARDEASRIINSFARNIGGAGAGAAAGLTPFEQSLRNISMRLDQFGRASTLAGAAMVGLGFAGASFIKSAIDVAAEYDKQSRLTLTQVDKLGVKLEDVAAIGRRVANQVGMPFESMQKTLYLIFSSIDVSMGQAEEMLKKFSQEAIAGSTDVDKAARLSISIMNSLGYSVDQLSHLQDVQFQIVRKGVITYEELADTLGRALPATARAGQSIETVGAMIAFLTRGGLSAAMAASSAARAMEAFAHPTVVKRLEAMGISVRDMHGNFLPLLDVMAQMNQKIGQLAAPDRAKFLQELFTGAGGTIQARRFWDLAFKNFDDFSAMVDNMKNSSGVFQSAYETMAGSVAVQSELIRNKWMLIKEAMGKQLLPQVLKFISILGRLLDWFQKLPEPTKQLITQILVWGTVISLVVGALLILIGTLAMVVSWIIAGGEALAIMLGVMVAIIAVIGGLTAAINYMYTNSKNFRDLLSEIGDGFKRVWDIGVNTFKAIRTSFETDLLPALQKLWAFIDKNVLPVILDLSKKFRDDLMPWVQRAASVFKTIVVTTFKLLADIIVSWLIPAIQQLVDWYHKHQAIINPIIKVLAILVGLIVVLAAVIAALPVVAFGILVAAVIASVVAVVELIKFLGVLWGWIKTAGIAIGHFFVMLWNGIVDIGRSIGKFFVTLWTTIVDIVKGAGKLVMGIVTGFLTALYNTIWVPFWNMFGGLIKEVWGLFLDIINFFIVLIKEAIKDWIMPLVRDVVAAWNLLVYYVTGAVSYLVGEVKKYFNIIVNDIVDAWNTLKGYTIAGWNIIIGWIKYAINLIKDNIIKPVMDGITYLWNTYLKQWYDDFVAGFNRLKDNVKAWIQFFKDIFSNAKNMLVDTGKNIIQGLIDGLTDKIHELREKLKKLTEDIPNWKGPRALDLMLLTPTGRNIMMGLSKGIAAQVPYLKRQLQGITTEIGAGLPTPNLSIPATANGPRVPSQTTNYQYITVNTQEIDPKAHAAELGWLLQARV